MDRTGLDQFTLKLLRKQFLSTCGRLTFKQQRELFDSGTRFRFSLMVNVMRSHLSPERWTAFLRYIEHSARDLHEMCAGDYPISPYLMRVFSALFGITVDYLLLGSAPCVDKVGTTIDVGLMA